MSVCDSGDVKLDAAVNNWLKLDKNPTTRNEVFEDISNGRWDKLRGSMLQRLKFGTAGLRGRMGAGYKAMNDVVVLQTAQGLCSYIKKVCNPSQIQNGVVIGFDGRYNSKKFAELTAKVFVSSSIPVHMFREVVATPLVSFGTIHYNAVAGVMVTASHNPREDNGYKVYWRNGCQILSPHDDNVLEEIKQCLDIPDEHWNIKDIRSNPLVSDCHDEVTNKYMETIITPSPEVSDENRKAAIDVVYSAMHGEPISVKQQQDPNPEFPTVTFPNPEELDTLKLSIELAEQKNVKLVLVNDPDADRLAQNKMPLFAFEEAIGYMCDHRVPEKDGVSAAVQVASLASHLYLSGSSIVKQLDALYAEFGYHVTYNKYYICHEPATIQKIFRRIRNYSGPGQYPKKVGDCEIVFLNDFVAGVKIPEKVNGEGHLSEMIMFRCSNGLSVTFRTSGTEPKLKYYSELVCQAPTRSEQESMNEKLKVMVKEFVEELLQPKENGLLG
ncbi:hypothetical protein HF086_015432 [Spodoptera exigua]|uniref:Phosphoglucomutase n=1 Tax=Spodoptera exigua TaxID=7107 RepID=A0A922SMN7_SPOEX|nr:hypothetical protein HF086_015432 [Spodoptera exigua]